MKKLLIALSIASTFSMSAYAQEADTLNELFTDGGREITVAEFPMVETARNLLIKQDEVGVNNFLHKRELSPTDKQDIVRMNRDTYYSFATINVSKGATVTIPEVPEGKYVSIQVVTEDHRIQQMKYGAGTFNLDTHTGDHIYLVVRLDSTIPAEEAHAIQDKMHIDAKSNEVFTYEGRISQESFAAVEDDLKKQMAGILKRDGAQALTGMFTSPNDESSETFTKEKYYVGTAIGWGGAQEVDNIYEVSGQYPANVCHQATFEDPKNQAFLSVTVYNQKGFMFNDVAHVNTSTAEYNDDGTLTFSFGCGDGAPNNLTTTEGNDTDTFTLAFRHYMPSKAVLDGFRVIPLVKPVK
ncbi:hypothetical protein CW745_00690 [Psychromonas sp. psych-6C06]|uniref:DUF1254 domain-containing protein n=1 Tax=Psychromonas sp. psych-6C06 TaxID=2058089 RepID=UPI000C33B6C4|nr:DUF1254 domain-containing protein [Psychromonas sp. psych-6C06]PKF63399.1 hypothetical protein CW745_00690 [Psychromonas sp. psych-6C06]